MIFWIVAGTAFSPTVTVDRPVDILPAGALHTTAESDIHTDASQDVEAIRVLPVSPAIPVRDPVIVIDTDSEAGKLLGNTFVTMCSITVSGSCPLVYP